MRLTSWVVDLYFLRRPVVKLEGADYYEYVMTYFDDIIAGPMYSVGILEYIVRFARINNDKIEPPSD